MKKKDLINRQDVIDAISKLPVKVDDQGYTWMIASDVLNQIDNIPEHCCYNCDCLENQHYCLLHGLAVDLGMGCGDWEPEKDENNERH